MVSAFMDRSERRNLGMQFRLPLNKSRFTRTNCFLERFFWETNSKLPHPQESVENDLLRRLAAGVTGEAMILVGESSCHYE
jgi:hypothetical protein